MEKDNQDFKIWAHLEEIKLRGSYLSIAADIDWILAMIISKCFNSNQQEIEALHNKPFHKFTLFEKIETTKVGLKKYYPDFYLQNEVNLNSIDKLREFRNILAHGKFDWDFNTKRKDLLFISEMKKEGITKNEYNLNDLWKELQQFHRDTNDLLSVLSNFLKR